MIVATARRVQLATNIAQSLDQATFDVHVDIFQFEAKLHFAALDLTFDFAQRLFDQLKLVRGDQILLAEHAGVSDRAANVLLIKTVIEANALAESFQAFVAARFENSASRR